MKKLFFSISLSVVLLPALFLLGSMATAYISPVKLHVLTFGGFLFPLLWPLNLLIFFWLLVRKSKLLIIPLCALIVSWTHMTNSFQFKAKTISEADSLQQPLRVMTYNTHMFDFYNHSGLKGSPEAIFDFIVQQNPDVICFQEYFTSLRKTAYSPSQIIARFRQYGYRHIEYSKLQKGNTGYGLATFSRYPIINKGSIPFERTSNQAIYTDINVNGTTIRVFNNHLESIGFKDSDLSVLDTIDLRMNQYQREGLRNISRKLNRAFAMRSNQAEAIARHISNSPYPVVVCGDFNDTPVSYVYRTMRGNLKDAFKESGAGFGGTYNGRLPSFRIDYIFHSPEFESWNFKRFPIKYSDHFPIMTTIDLKTND